MPFLYLSKDDSLMSVPFGISLDREEEGGEAKILGVKIVQKTLHSESSYQIFELGKQGTDPSDDFGFFSLNIATMNDVKIWQP